MLNLSHKKLEVYKMSLLMVKEIYLITNDFPKDERFSLTGQLRRAAVSVSSNLAEGAARISSKEKKRFFEISRASLVEVDTQLEIALLMGYTSGDKIIIIEKQLESIFRILSKLINNQALTPHSPLTTNYSPLPTHL